MITKLCRMHWNKLAFMGLLALMAVVGSAQSGWAKNLVIAKDGATNAVIAVSPDAGEWEAKAAADLRKYIDLMSGAKPALANTAAAIKGTFAAKTPVIYVGQLALKTKPSLQKKLDSVKKKDPLIRADAIVAQRDGNRVYLAGTNDDSHYFAVAWLLQQWGCRWYMPTKFGEYVPRQNLLAIGKLNYAYAPPFELRSFWISWNGTSTGHADFLRRNMMNATRVPAGHSLSKYVKDLVPKDGSIFDVPIATDATAEHVAKQLEKPFGESKNIGLGMNDGVYHLSDPLDEKLQAGIFDKYFQGPSYTDNFMTFYDKVCSILLKKHPDSKSLIGFLAYSNITIPPQRKWTAAKPLVAKLAPIDIDPNHGMDSPQSPSRREFGDMMRRWAKVMDGRVLIYDYDQGMLVWRDIPDPSYMAFEDDVKNYRDAGILGVSTESRGALATDFINMYLRSRLMWNPDANVDQILDEFYPRFYGPAAKPMKKYWTAIFDAWKNTIVTEHEYFVIPAIYTPELVKELGGYMKQAQQDITPLQVQGKALTTNQKNYVAHVDFTQHGYEVLRLYTQTIGAAATDANYPKAAAIGQKARAAQLALGNLNPLFTTRVVGRAAQSVKNGPAWFPGEMAQYGDLAKLVDGTKGKLIQKTPLEWAFHRDPHDTGLVSGWAYKPANLNYWNAHKNDYNIDTRKNYPYTKWAMLRTDQYMQAQGVRSSDAQSYSGYYWYKTDASFTKKQLSGKTHLMFPGLFNVCWLYVNGNLVAHRDYKEPWWRSGYNFEWDVDLSEYLKPGKNTITLRGDVPNHMGGIFRRPFFYQPVE